MIIDYGLSFNKVVRMFYLGRLARVSSSSNYVLDRISPCNRQSQVGFRAEVFFATRYYAAFDTYSKKK